MREGALLPLLQPTRPAPSAPGVGGRRSAFRLFSMLEDTLFAMGIHSALTESATAERGMEAP